MDRFVYYQKFFNYVKYLWMARYTTEMPFRVAFNYAFFDFVGAFSIQYLILVELLVWLLLKFNLPEKHKEINLM